MIEVDDDSDRAVTPRRTGRRFAPRTRRIARETVARSLGRAKFSGIFNFRFEVSFLLFV